MNINCQYNKVQSSESLSEYANWKFQSLRKHNMGDAEVTIKISKVSYNCVVDVYVNSNVGSLKVRAESEDFYESVDLALGKVTSQVCKKQGQKWGKQRRSKRRHRYDKLEEMYDYMDAEMDYEEAG